MGVGVLHLRRAVVLEADAASAGDASIVVWVR